MTSRWWFALLLSACAASGPDDKTPADDAAEETAEDAASLTSEPGEAAADPSASPEAAKPEPVAGPFSEARVQEIVRANFEKMGACYAEGLQRDAEMKGTINVSLTIDGDGEVVRASAPKSDQPKPKPPPARKLRYWEKKKPPPEEFITDTQVVGCVETEFKALRFPPTGRGMITLLYPMVFKTE